MIGGYPYRSRSRRLIGFAFGMFVGAVILSLSCIVLEPLLPVLLGVTSLTLMILVWLRWLMFRLRGW